MTQSLNFLTVKLLEKLQLNIIIITFSVAYKPSVKIKIILLANLVHFYYIWEKKKFKKIYNYLENV